MNKQLDNILIVEDEPLIAEDISSILSSEGYGILGIAHNANNAIKLVKASLPSLVLLDINIEDDINGLMLAQIIKDEFQVPFIFLTSHTDKQTLDKVKALKPYGFIVKPFDDKELVTNIELAIAKFKEENSKTVLESTPDDNSLFIKQDGSLIKVSIDEILYAEAFDNYCFVHTIDKKFLLPHTLKSVEKKLSGKSFLRVHRSYMINLKSISVINDDHLVINNKSIPVSKASRQELLSRISTF